MLSLLNLLAFLAVVDMQYICLLILYTLGICLSSLEKKQSLNLNLKSVSI